MIVLLPILVVVFTVFEFCGEDLNFVNTFLEGRFPGDALIYASCFALVHFLKWKMAVMWKERT